MPPSTTRGRRDCRCPRVRHRHGTEPAYTADHCRCLPCRLARQSYVAQLRAGEPALPCQTVPVGPVRLRLQALTWLGYSPPEIAARSGLNFQVVARWRDTYDDDFRVLLHNYEAVVRIYDELWCTPSTGLKATRMRNLARARGWAPPLALDDDALALDVKPVQYKHQLIYEMGKAEIIHVGNAVPPEIVDEIAVERAVKGEHIHLTRAELSQARDTLERMGLSAREIGERLGMSGRTVQRRRAQERAA